ncbi:MAG: 3-deoxy-8-phosphooctulonate synthase [Longimicrobiales bacterium]|nr:3-deoxy-8-phosphooctulonate synthase [Longimicrobiales bacterium]
MSDAPETAPLFQQDGRFFVIAGPCVLEDDALNLRVGTTLAEIGEALDLPIIFKASFDKANRSRSDSPRGPGLEDGLERLARVKAETGLPVITDIHVPSQAAAAAEVCDVLQIPAFLCRQTDLLEAAGATGRSVNIKKGQWMAPEDMAGAVEKVRWASGDANAGVSVTERGTFHGYGDLVVDMRSFLRMRDATGAPAVFDGTHSVQRPGMGEGVSGGDPEFIGPLVRAAVAAGADGLFLEVHPTPREAPSDATNMLRLEAFRPLLEDVLAIRGALSGREGGARG